jgi:hypothetical protein
MVEPLKSSCQVGVVVWGCAYLVQETMNNAIEHAVNKNIFLDMAAIF